MRSSARMSDATMMVNRTGVLELRRLSENVPIFGDPARIQDPQAFMEACCALVENPPKSAWAVRFGHYIGVGIALVDCLVAAAGDDEGAMQFGHRIAIDMRDGLFACSAEKQTYPLLKSALLQKGIFGFRDMRVLDFTHTFRLGEPRVLPIKMRIRLNKWKLEVANAASQGNSDCDALPRKKKA